LGLRNVNWVVAGGWCLVGSGLWHLFRLALT
jgi:hypothetical protein